MTDEIDEAAFRRVVLKLRGEDPGEGRPASRRYEFDDLNQRRFADWNADRAAKVAVAKANPEPKPAPASDWAAFDERIAAFVEAAVGPAIEEISNSVAAELDKEGAARAKLEDRVRELMLEQAKALSTIARLEVSLAHIELRLADRRGGAIIDANPSLKSIN
jgi:hypothetical protein